MCDILAYKCIFASDYTVVSSAYFCFSRVLMSVVNLIYQSGSVFVCVSLRSGTECQSLVITNSKPHHCL